MPVLHIATPGKVSRETRADLAARATTAVAEAAEVDPDKVHIFFSTADTLRVAAHLVAAPFTETIGRVGSALSHAGFKHVAITPYAPDHTARGGKLRSGEAQQ